MFAAQNNFLRAQSANDTATMMLRIYEDNDFINFYGKGTDNAYTNGTSIDLFYTKKNKTHFIIDKLMPKAGDSSINIYSLGIAQIMFTPNDLSDTQYQPDDYPYSGALYATHTLYSYNAEKKYDLQTELLIGASGPASLTQQTQKLIHQIMNFQPPMGWRYQEKNALLININFTAEKQLAAYKGIVEVIGGAQIFAGTMTNALSIYSEIRIGKMNPYFNGYISQYSKITQHKKRNKVQAYLFAKPQANAVFTNEILQGKATMTTSDKSINSPGIISEPYHKINMFDYYFNYGGVITSGCYSVSISQTSNSALLKGLYKHQYGNISLYVNW